MCVDFIVISESEIVLNTRAWKLSRSRDARVGIVITITYIWAAYGIIVCFKLWEKINCVLEHTSEALTEYLVQNVPSCYIYKTIIKVWVYKLKHDL
jgi:hypothetical protein